jgi:hypothetical protein
MRSIPATINHFWVWMLLVVLGMGCLTETGCSKKAPKYPEDHARFQRVVLAIKTLETAYVNKDGPALHELLLPLEQLEILEAEARQDFAQFSTIQLDLNINRIIVDGNRISAFISWQGKWQPSTQEPGDQARGQGVLLWSGNQVILLRGVEGDLPFGMAARLNVPS